MNTTTRTSDGARKERFEARIPSAQKRLLQAAAKMEGRSLSDFVISSALSAARDVVKTLTLLELSQKDQALFADALIDPPKPNERFARAAASFSEKEKR